MSGSDRVATETITTAEGRFTADVAGPPAGPLVLLLHGFPQSRHAWRDQLPALARAGYRAIAPDQRGYSPGVRPDPAAGLAAYAVDRIARDVLDLADAAAPQRASTFHLVGHDWGGQIAWVVAHRHPERIASLTVLSRPHPEAFRRAYASDVDGQQQRSAHHRAFHDPATAGLLLADGARRLRAALAEQGVPEAALAGYLTVLGEPAALEAALAWYRAAGTLASVEVGAVAVPTLYVWGDADRTVGPTAAHATRDFVRAPYRFEVLPGVGHFVTDEAPARVNELVLAHLAANAAGTG
ncbi:MAG TPA: alpha/beta hydrolase [Candidatus Binatia bacterium]|nr:alpha/beta hydrolase [Candidatus Binatia bacterium]